MNGQARWVKAGYSIVLAGAVGFVVGCFLPYVGTSQFASRPLSIWQLSTAQGSASETLGAVGNLFPGPVVLAAISFWGIRARRRWIVPALVVTTIVWSLARIGGLAFTYSIYDGHMGVGYWLMLACVVLVMVGTSVVFVSSRAARSPVE